MNHLLTQFIAWGYPAVSLVVALESLGAPLPGETVMIGLGAAAGAAHQSLVGIFIAVWAGAVIGDNIGYWIGRRYGRDIILRHGGRFGATPARLERAEGLFQRYGLFVVFAARFFVFLRQFNGIMAGALHLPWWRFLIANGLGAAAWVGFWLYASSRLSGTAIHFIDRLHVAKSVLFSLALGAAAIVVAVWLARRLLLRKAGGDGGNSPLNPVNERRIDNKTDENQ